LISARTPDQFFGTLDEMLTTDEFDCATLELREDEPLFEPYSIRYRRWTANGSHIVWVWEHGDTDVDEVLSSNQFWSLRIPLMDEGGKNLGAITFYRCLLDGAPSIDIAHICGNLQRELSAALVRLKTVEVKG
jgi:hypothetical protein